MLPSTKNIRFLNDFSHVKRHLILRISDSLNNFSVVKRHIILKYQNHQINSLIQKSTNTNSIRFHKHFFNIKCSHIIRISDSINNGSIYDLKLD